MKFLITTLIVALTGLVTADKAAPAAPSCPIITKSVINPSCTQSCNNDCRFITTIANPCGCPSTIPIATLQLPCGDACPYAGCEAIFSQRNERCTSTLAPPSSTKTSSSQTVVITSVTVLPPRPPITSTLTTNPPRACPTVTMTTRPGDCEPIRCPIPGCAVEENMVLPCGCASPSTMLMVAGCSSACPEGCMTRTRTVSELCGSMVVPQPTPLASGA